MQNPTQTSESFTTTGYALLPNLVTERVRSFLYEYALKSAGAGKLKSGDSGVSETPCFYSDAFMEWLLEALLPDVELQSGLSLYPTYSYFRVYKHGDVLARHQD